ncbi:MAG: HD domain-containing protein [Endomicrobiaceae bacterium]|jgi:metal-dependent HD superfamily phosphatase/phosphodiesterase|nr:HD domain-containing protein [Endomicrobiaceae bacterium]MDD3729705.1 HD domain-containing protein [Endomicrobiaceae bacterium]MDD4166068.1 HD domain-containing protein [Endomicrobiaceae bacterium]
MNTKELEFSQVSFDDIKSNQTIDSFIRASNDYLGAIGYTEHGFRHVSLVASVSKNILATLGYPKRLQELAEIAGYLHDIGNVINRQDHGQSASLIAFDILKQLGATPDEIALVASAIGNHEEEIGEPVNPVAAALILADKSDVHKTRVRNPSMIAVDIHDRVNYAVDRSFLTINKEEKLISLNLNVDTKISQVIEYFEIFMSRMNMCRRAAKFLDCKFELIINERKLL